MVVVRRVAMEEMLDIEGMGVGMGWVELSLRDKYIT